MQWASNRQWMTNDEDRNFSRSHRASSLLCVAGLEGSLACFFFCVTVGSFSVIGKAPILLGAHSREGFLSFLTAEQSGRGWKDRVKNLIQKHAPLISIHWTDFSPLRRCSNKTLASFVIFCCAVRCSVGYGFVFPAPNLISTYLSEPSYIRRLNRGRKS